MGRKGPDRRAASTSQMGRFETKWLATQENLAALTILSGLWIDRVHERRPPKIIILDMDSSESPAHGDQEGSAYNRHFGRTCYHPLFCLNRFGDLERCLLRPGNVQSAGVGGLFSIPWLLDIGIGRYAAPSGRMPPSPSPRFTSSWKPKAMPTRSTCRPTRSCRSSSRGEAQ